MLKVGAEQQISSTLSMKKRHQIAQTFHRIFASVCAGEYMRPLYKH